MQTRHAVADEATSALRAGNHEAALAGFTRLVHDDPGHPIWRLRLADVAQQIDPEAAAAQRALVGAAAQSHGRPLWGLVAALADGPEATARYVGPFLRGALPDDVPIAPERRPTPPPLGPLPKVPVGVGLPPPPMAAEPAGPCAMPILSLVDAEAFASLAGHICRVSVAPGELLIREGEPARRVYLIAAGELEVQRRDANGRPALVARPGEGTLVGEMALVLHRTRSATVCARTHVEAAAIDLTALYHVIKTHREVGDALVDFTRARMVSLMLATSPFFRTLPLATRDVLLDGFQTRRVEDGTVVIDQGQRGDTLYVVAGGQVDVTRAPPTGGDPICLARLGPGEVFGEIGLLTAEPAMATVAAVGPTTLLSISVEALDEVCRLEPIVQDRLTEIGMARDDDNRSLFEHEFGAPDT